jgi:PncC family amidohydrolase
MKTSLENLAHILKEKNQTLCTMESCTGGTIAGLITSRSGASEYFLGGVVPYSDTAKHTMIHVSLESLSAHGAVSREVAKEMLLGGLEAFGADYGIATTGFAGPAGGTEKYPLGTVVIAVGSRALQKIEVLHFDTNQYCRSEIVETTTQRALEALVKFFDVE